MRRYNRFLPGIVLVCAACDIPTELPRWNPVFAIELEGTRISVVQLLPASVALANNNTAFNLALQPTTFSQTLGALCPACAALDGLIVPKPGFSGSFTSSIALPADVQSATLLGGRARFTATHNFSFDPIQPGGNVYGILRVTLMNGATVLGAREVTGQETSFTPGSTLVDSIVISGGTMDGPVIVQVDVISPAGLPTQMNSQARLTVTATPTSINVGSALVRVNNRQVSAQAVQINLTGIDQFIVNRVRSGKLVLAISNPFGVSGTFDLTVSGAAIPIKKSVQLPAGDATIEVLLSEAELRSMLGQSVIFAFSGIVTSGSGVSVVPGSEFAVQPLLVLELGPDA